MLLEMLKYLFVLAVFYAVCYWVYNYQRRSRTMGRIPSYRMKHPPKVKRVPKRTGPFKSPKPDMYKRLMTSCLGDEAKVERLIAYEQKRNSALSREQAIRAALDRLEYDLKL